MVLLGCLAPWLIVIITRLCVLTTPTTPTLPRTRTHPYRDFTNLIKAFSAAGQPESALQVLVLMNQRKGGDKAATLHYNAAMHAFARQGRMRDAEAVLEEMKMRQVEPDAGSYNVLIAGFERQRQPDRALALYDEMTRRGIAPDAYVLNSLVAVTADMKDRARANQLLQRFRSLAGDPATGAAADPAAATVVYGALMHALAKADAAGRREVLALLEEFKAKGYAAPNTIMYNEALYACYRLVREDVGMAGRALGLFREMLPLSEAAATTPTTGAAGAAGTAMPAGAAGSGAAPDALTFRRLFKVLKQARRFAEIVDIAASLPRELLVSHERIGVPVVTACLRQGEQARALDLLGELALRPNASYGTLRWAALTYCTKVTPPDVNAAETVLALAEERGWKADRGFHHAVMRGLWRMSDVPRALEVWHALPEKFQGGDGGAVAILCHMDRGRLERVSPLLEVMRTQDDVAGADLMVAILEKLVGGQDFKLALEAVELMIDHDVAVTRAERRRIEALAMQNAQHRQGAMEVLEGLALLPVQQKRGGGPDDDGEQEEDEDEQDQEP
jgi:pentatricopeptide repeat protein